MQNEVYYCGSCERQQQIEEGEFCKECGQLTVSWYTHKEGESIAIGRWNRVNGLNYPNGIFMYESSSKSLTYNFDSMSVQKLQLQLEKLQEMEKFLGKLYQIFQQNSKIYNDKMLMLRQSGMPEEVCNTYDQKYQVPKVLKMQKMMQEIHQADMPYIKKNIVAINNALQAAK